MFGCRPSALAALAPKMEVRKQRCLPAALRLLEDPEETDAGRLSRLGEALAELAGTMEPTEATRCGSAWRAALGPGGNRC